MRFKTQKYTPSAPNIDLIPMLNVMMSVLAFFVLVSVGLAPRPTGVNIQLPSEQASQEQSIEQLSNHLVITLKLDETFTINNRNLNTLQELIIVVENYLQTEKEGIVLLMAEEQVSYQKVMQSLTELKTIGGERVSLGIEGE